MKQTSNSHFPKIYQLCQVMNALILILSDIFKYNVIYGIISFHEL